MYLAANKCLVHVSAEDQVGTHLVGTQHQLVTLCVTITSTAQVEFMTSQMSEMQREVDDKLKTEGALKAAEQAGREVCALSTTSCNVAAVLPLAFCKNALKEVCVLWCKMQQSTAVLPLSTFTDPQQHVHLRFSVHNALQYSCAGQAEDCAAVSGRKGCTWLPPCSRSCHDMSQTSLQTCSLSIRHEIVSMSTSRTSQCVSPADQVHVTPACRYGC